MNEIENMESEKLMIYQAFWSGCIIIESQLESTFSSLSQFWIR